MSDDTQVTKQDGAGNGASDVAPQDGQSKTKATMMPPVDVIEDANGITLLADLPGVTREGLKLQLDSDSLTIEGDVALNTPQGMASSYAEIRLPSYRRVFTLSKELDGEKTTAEFKQGVLTLHIPKAAHAQPKKIEVSVA